MQTIYLRFANAETAKQAVLAYGLARLGAPPGETEPRLIVSSPGHLDGVRVDVDVIGTLYVAADPPQFTEGPDGARLPVMEAAPGYHVNILWHGDDPPPLDLLTEHGGEVVTPGYQSRAFAA